MSATHTDGAVATKTALAFSGGKDAWACLWLNKHRLAEITVFWVNTGKNYPEILETIAKAKSMCPNFVEVIVDREGQNAYHGIPADIVPVEWTRVGHEHTYAKPVMIQAYTQCCAENISLPAINFCKANGITHLIRGQRLDDSHKSSARDGMTVDGIQFVQPIETWTSDQVIAFVAQHMELPSHFRFEHSSMDCYDCTAFTAETRDRVAYTKLNHPLLHAEYQKRRTALNDALTMAIKQNEE